MSYQYGKTHSCIYPSFSSHAFDLDCLLSRNHSNDLICELCGVRWQRGETNSTKVVHFLDLLAPMGKYTMTSHEIVQSDSQRPIMHWEIGKWCFGVHIRDRSLGGSESNEFLWKIFSWPTRCMEKKIRSLLDILPKIFDAHSYNRNNMHIVQVFSSCARAIKVVERCHTSSEKFWEEFF